MWITPPFALQPHLSRSSRWYVSVSVSDLSVDYAWYGRELHHAFCLTRVALYLTRKKQQLILEENKRGIYHTYPMNKPMASVNNEQYFCNTRMKIRRFWGEICRFWVKFDDFGLRSAIVQTFNSSQKKCYEYLSVVRSTHRIVGTLSAESSETKILWKCHHILCFLRPFASQPHLSRSRVSTFFVTSHV